MTDGNNWTDKPKSLESPDSLGYHEPVGMAYSFIWKASASALFFEDCPPQGNIHPREDYVFSDCWVKVNRFI